MAVPPNNFQQHYEPQHSHLLHHQQQQQSSKPLWNFFAMDGQISPQLQYCNLPNFQDQSQHPPFVPTSHVVGFGPETVPFADGSNVGVDLQLNNGSDVGVDLQWNNGFKAEKKKPKVHEFLQNNSQMSSVDLLLSCPVSTGLELSLYNNTNSAASSRDSLLLGDDIERELRQQDAEFDRFLKIQGEQLRQAVLDKVQTSNLHILSYVEQKVLQKLRDKEAEIESMDKKSVDLEERIEQLTEEAFAWKQHAMLNENMINTLKFSIQQAYAQNGDSKEGCGDSEVDDTASCCNGPSVDIQLLSKENSNMRELMTCKVCRINSVCMLLLPCRHLCLCNDCESKLSYCPLCMSPKSTGMKVDM